MFSKANEKGQALILIALAAIGLFAFSALAIDGSRVYSDKRHAQNAADTAALTGALAYARPPEDDEIEDCELDEDEEDYEIKCMAQAIATVNGYDGGAKSDVTITIEAAPVGCLSGEGLNITVSIVSYLDTTLARVIGRNEITNAVTATTHVCRPDPRSVVEGNAIVGCNTNNAPDPNHPCGLDTGSSASDTWNITGGGIHSNGCITHKNGTLNIPNTPPNQKCISTAGDGSGNDTSGGGAHSCVEVNRPSLNCDALMPPDPCTGTPDPTGRYPGGGKIATSPQVTFDNDIYCLADIDYFDGELVRINNATLYVTDLDFSVKYTGAKDTGGFIGTATRAGTDPGNWDEEYAGFAMIVAIQSPPCVKFQTDDQALALRGNSGGTLTGTILAPSACIEMRGTSGWSLNGQVIGYTVTSNGTAGLNVNFNPDNNPFKPVNGNLSLWE